MRLAAVALAGVALASCTNLPSGGRNTVRFITEPAGALATTSLGPSCTTPCALPISRLDNFSVTFTLDGHESRTVDVASIEPRLSGGMRVTEVGGYGVRVGLVNNSSMQDPAGNFRREHTPNPVEAVLPRAGAR